MSFAIQLYKWNFGCMLRKEKSLPRRALADIITDGFLWSFNRMSAGDRQY